MIKLKSILREAGLLAEQTSIDPIEFKFDDNEFTFRADQQQQVDKVIAQVKSAQATGGKVKKITIESSESQVPSKQFKELELATKRAETLRNKLKDSLPDATIEIDPKIGNETYTSGIDNAKDTKYDKDRYVRVKIEMEVKPPPIKQADYSNLITITANGTGIFNSREPNMRYAEVMLDRAPIAIINVSPEYTSVAPNPSAFPKNVPGNKLAVNKKNMPMILKAFNVDTLEDFIKHISNSKY